MADLGKKRVTVQETGDEFLVGASILADVEVELTLDSQTLQFPCEVVEQLAPTPQVYLRYRAEEDPKWTSFKMAALAKADGERVDARITIGPETYKSNRLC